MPPQVLAASVIALVLGCILVSTPLAAASADDMATVRQRLLQSLVDQAPDDAWARKNLDAQQDDGSWPDVDYDAHNRNSWLTSRHVTRLSRLAEVYRNPDRKLAGDRALREAIAQGLGFWLDHDFKSPNWWFNEIYVPEQVGHVLLLMGDDLPAPMRKKAIDPILTRATIRLTGQNRVWLSQNVLVHGLLINDQDMVANAAQNIFDPVRISTDEGIQPDGSFHQHGPQQQFGNYGLAFARTITHWGLIFRDTDFDLTDQQLRAMRRFFLDGLRWVVWRGRMDVAGLGRQLSPHGQQSRGNGAKSAFKRMAQLDPEHARDYALLSTNRPKKTPTDKLPPVGFTGDRAMWRSDMLVHRRPGYYVSVKMCSTRVIGNESLNGENQLGAHFADGATYLYQRGDEYAGLFPVWDWHCVPGTTAPADGPLPEFDIHGYANPSDFVGAASDGEVGVAAMVLGRDELHARKAWFTFDDMVACLGSDIRSGVDRPIATTLDQCRLRGPVTWHADGETHTLDHTGDDAATLADADWVCHAGVGYVPLSRTDLTLSARAQSGSWHRVATSQPKKTVEADVFRLGINHGVKPEGAGYAYALVPGTTPDELARDGGGGAGLGIKVMSNTAGLQAVRRAETGMVQAVFYQPGEIELNEKTTLTVDQPCLLIARPTAQGWRLNVADPTHQLTELTLQLTGHDDITLTLPTGGDAGKTLTRDLPAGR